MSEQERQVAEEQREEAEQTRERRELQRRINEGGPEQHVSGNDIPGRVEAEEERVVAELGEAGRVESEADRVSAEIGRTEASQVRREAEAGRVQAENVRVDAEEKRANVRRFYVKVATSIALPLAFITLIPALVGLWRLEQEINTRTSENAGAIVRLDVLTAQGVDAHQALCVFRGDLAKRALETRQFIDEVASGARPAIPGISTADLERSLANQKATLDTLGSLDC